MEVNRRRFLGFTVGAAAGTALGVPASRTLSDLIEGTEQPVYPLRGKEDAILSVCRLCPGGCGIRVRRVGQRAVKVDGNPLHPISRGRLCPKGQAALQALYHPDRLAGPLRRVGPKGSLESFERVTWDQALAEIGARLKELRTSGRPESLALVRGSSRGLGARLASRFLAAFGSPNDVALDRGDEAASLAVYLGQGVRAVPAYDLQASDYVLSFGGALLEAWSSPVYTMQGYGAFRQGHLGTRGKMVQVEPRRSITAGSADEWVPVRPGSEGMLALGVARALVAEGLYDREFVRLRTVGLEPYVASDGSRREGLRALLERDYSLERVAAETGVPVNVILRLARELGFARASLAVGPRKGPLVPGPLFDHLAVQVLNALVGNIDAPERMAAALERVPLVVSFASLPDDTAVFADWILPEAHFLESWDLDTTPPGVPYPAVTLTRPVVEPLNDVRPAAEILLALAAQVGGEVASALAWRDLNGLMRQEVDGLFAARRGAIMGTGFDEAWARMMERAGWWAPGYETAAELWRRMQESGGWWDPFYDHGDWQRVLQTASGRYEFRTDLLQRLAAVRAVGPDVVDLAEPQGRGAEEAAEPSLPLVLFEPLALAGGSGAELPFLQEILDPVLEERWRTWVEIHPETAARLGVGDRDRVRLASPQGAIEAVARVTSRVVAECVAVPLGLGKRQGGRWARGRGANPLRLLSSDRDPGSGLPNFDGIRVQVSVVARYREQRS